jgi:hypothetical protein
MGTEIEQAPVNDNELHWYLRGPDADGFVWLVWRGDDAREMLNLGSSALVQGAFVDWIAREVSPC